MNNRLGHFAFVFLSTFLLVACPRRYAAWVVPGSSVRRLLVAVGDRRESSGGIEVGLFAVARCADHDSAIVKPGMYSSARLKRLPWAITSTAGSVVLQRIEYGKNPRGFRQLSANALALDSGCYVAEVDGGSAGGSAYVRFEIDPEGRATEISSSGRPNTR